jgi:hypothetical protein
VVGERLIMPMLKSENCKIVINTEFPVCSAEKDNLRCSLPVKHKGKHHAHGLEYDGNKKEFHCLLKW